MKELNKSIENTSENVEAAFEELVNREEFVCCGEVCGGNGCVVAVG